MHGHARLTADIDLITDLHPLQARKTVEALVRLGLKPRAPVDASEFADPACRESWIRDKGMRVFSFWDPSNPMREVDLFVEHPIPFESLYERSKEIRLSRSTVRIAAIEDLITLKQIAGRPHDQQDIEALRQLQRQRSV